MGKSFCSNGRRTKKLIRCPQFLTQLQVARTFGYQIFKTESLEDLPFEQYKVLIRLIDQMNKERLDLEKTMGQEPKSTYINNGMVKQTITKGRTFRIINEPK